MEAFSLNYFLPPRFRLQKPFFMPEDLQILHNAFISFLDGNPVHRLTDSQAACWAGQSPTLIAGSTGKIWKSSVPHKSFGTKRWAWDICNEIIGTDKKAERESCKDVHC